MQTLLIIQRTRLYYGYRTVFLKQNGEKLGGNHKTFTCNFRAIFRLFSADFSAQFACNLCNLYKLRAILAHFRTNSAQMLHFPRDFLQGLGNGERRHSVSHTHSE